MERFYGKACDPKSMHALNLAFIGDSVFDMFVRESLVCKEEVSVSELHKAAVEMVRCQAQAHDAKVLFPVLTQDEQQIYMRGRNAHSRHIPKNASPADYHAATAIEAVFGYLYLKGKFERLRHLFSIILEE